MNNVDIAKSLGITTRLAAYQKPNQYDHKSVDILDSKGGLLHSAWYSNPDDYEYIINHVIAIGRLPNWERKIAFILELCEEVPFAKEYVIEKLSTE